MSAGDERHRALVDGVEGATGGERFERRESV